MFLKGLTMCIIGLCAGGMVAAGTFAFIVMIGIFTRMADRTHTSAYISIYESAVVLGGIIGNILFIYNIRLPLYQTGLVLFGSFSGIFVGSLAIALAEVLKVFPILVSRIKLVEGLPVLVLSIAAGKAIGSLIQFIYGWT